MNQKQKFGFLVWLKDILILCSGVSIIILFFYSIYLSIKVIYLERELWEAKPEDFQLPYVKLDVPVKPGLTLDGWLIPVTDAAGTIIMGQEYKAGKSTKLKYAQFLYHANYNVVLFEFRNYKRKKKEIFFRLKGLTEDLEAAIAVVRKNPELDGKPLVLYTFSFATLPALVILSKPNSNIQGMIFDSGPPINITALISAYIDVFKGMAIPAYLDGPIIYPLLRGIYSVMGSYLTVTLKWPPKLIPVSTKLLFITNEDDQMIPVQQVKKIVKRFPQADFWIAPESRHLMSFRDHKETYKKLVLDFLNKLS